MEITRCNCSPQLLPWVVTWRRIKRRILPAHLPCEYNRELASAGTIASDNCTWPPTITASVHLALLLLLRRQLFLWPWAIDPLQRPFFVGSTWVSSEWIEETRGLNNLSQLFHMDPVRLNCFVRTRQKRITHTRETDKQFPPRTKSAGDGMRRDTIPIFSGLDSNGLSPWIDFLDYLRTLLFIQLTIFWCNGTSYLTVASSTTTKPDSVCSIC